MDFLCQRQCEGGRRPLLGDAGQGQCTAMCSGDASHNGEPEARASCLPRAGFVYAVETFTEMREVLRGNTDAGITYLQESLFIFHLCTYHDPPSRPIVFDCVVEQCQYSLFKENRVADHYCCLVRFYPDTDLCLVGQGLHSLCSCEG